MLCGVTSCVRIVRVCARVRRWLQWRAVGWHFISSGLPAPPGRRTHPNLGMGAEHSVSLNASLELQRGVANSTQMATVDARCFAISCRGLRLPCTYLRH